MPSDPSTVTVLAAGGAIAAAKFIVAACTGSAAMVAEGNHSVVDSAKNLVLYFGLRRSRKPPDVQHLFG